MTAQRSLVALALGGALLLSPALTSAAHASGVQPDRVGAMRTGISVPAPHSALARLHDVSAPLTHVVLGAGVANGYQRAIPANGGIRAGLTMAPSGTYPHLECG